MVDSKQIPPSCREKDTTNTANLHPSHSLSISSTLPAYNNYHHHTPADIIPQCCPTVLHPLSSTFSELNLTQIPSNSLASSSTHEEDSGSDAHVLDLPGYPTPLRNPSYKHASIATGPAFESPPPL